MRNFLLRLLGVRPLPKNDAELIRWMCDRVEKTRLTTELRTKARPDPQPALDFAETMRSFGLDPDDFEMNELLTGYQIKPSRSPSASSLDAAFDRRISEACRHGGAIWNAQRSR